MSYAPWPGYMLPTPSRERHPEHCSRPSQHPLLDAHLPTPAAMSDSPLMLDGKVLRLRASCDSCNESKVRCSQSKPTCSRCQKQGTTCIYGLSRRSHRSAPRIGATSMPLLPQHYQMNTCTGAHSTDAYDQLDSFSAFLAMPPPFPASPIPTNFAASGWNTPSDSDSDSFQTPSCTLDAFPASDFDFDLNMALDSSLDDFGLRSPSLSCQDFPQVPFTSKAKCACVSRATTELMSTVALSNHEASSIDLQLSSIKRAIAVSHDCINCDQQCSKQELTVLTITLLLGRIIQGFDAALAHKESPTNRCDPDQSYAMSSSASPHLTWGTLSIEGDEELQLKRRLLLIHLQKLEGVLRQLSDSVKELRSRTDTNNSAYVIACECIHMWLDQRAQAVKRNLLLE
ncbi:hypothetical protein P171DRAFT_476526 [Karstenula rhodostoma CBS 690.94]|uniref:Zn(2)-C6 fungal-type domain-containing protein n=1 Tax=Karstenula rhodostoma CBS 690.94 TaxID=1392251 RepID=A0A9P4P6I4_9PLEO|nr:hypothetical protein P171DRAFT_476526 [Karstenula rhodostoma CBS 690.94]